MSLATAWTAGHRRWALAVAAWFGFTPLVFLAVSDLPGEFAARLVGGAVSDLALLAAVLLLGEAVRTRRALDQEHRLLVAEQERSEGLLLNVLPAPIATRLKSGEEPIADGFPEVTVLFADLVEFTRRSREISPAQVVEALNELFSTFDELARRHGLEKIKTVGDAYMVAGGLPEPRPDHAQAAAEMALAMLEEVAGRVDPAGEPSRSGSASTPARWWRASSAGTSSATTCGVTRSTRPAGWSRWPPPAASRSPTAPTDGSGTATGSSAEDRSKSRARARWSPGSSVGRNT